MPNVAHIRTVIFLAI